MNVYVFSGPNIWHFVVIAPNEETAWALVREKASEADGEEDLSEIQLVVQFDPPVVLGFWGSDETFSPLGFGALY